MSGHDINAVSENEQMAFYAIPNYSSSNKKDDLKEILDRVAPDYQRALRIIQEKQAEIETLASDFSNESERLKRANENNEKEIRKLKQEMEEKEDVVIDDEKRISDQDQTIRELKREIERLREDRASESEINEDIIPQA